ncbi:malectin-like carbohydrate-binding domain-containing protein [Artemisia annua]|uniref:Malectin-like carbohydrate-binding domain-containing protein n=1 Tax=Artemisia annua TaxID=35608 RepID=A0A2U1PXU4_ARTAN|nr:malectin-like carbohydrate-binding domain-containing protein [Artemisia annua]
MTGNFMLLPVLFLGVFTFSVSGQLIESIDCGASDITIDSNLITWTPDDILVSNGISRVVQSSYSVSTVMDTLRVFTSHKKNCYSLGPVIQGQKVLVRASFNYGNYDRLSNPPAFALHFDGNFWTTVETSLSGVTDHEAIYVAKGDAVSVCVAQTKPGQFPFISALELRSLDSDVYSELDGNRALFLSARLSYGASLPLRYPNDRYDRIWMPRTATGGVLLDVASDAIFVDTTTAPNNPPTGIFKNAVTVPSTFYSVVLGQFQPWFPPVYINMYFSEVKNLESTQTRSFNIFEKSTLASRYSQLPISPPYSGVVVRHLYNYKVDYSNTTLSLDATIYSDLPPLINGYELFAISDVLTDGTDSKDGCFSLIFLHFKPEAVEALGLLMSTFDVLGGWSGDPCLPAPYSWDWLNCSNDATPRVTSLYLDSFGLSGLLPDISSMDALEIIDLHNNSLSGEIPSFLGTLPNLQQLNLADNQFSGSIPTSLTKNSKLKLTVTGNPSLCTSNNSCSNTPGTINSPPGIVNSPPGIINSPPGSANLPPGSANSPPGTINSSPGSTSVTRKKKKSSMLPVILGITIPVFLLIWVAFGAFIILSKKSKPANVNMAPTTGGEENVNSGGEVNGTPEILQRIGEEMVNEIVGNVVQQAVNT